MVQMMEMEVNPHFEDFLFDWDQKFQFLVGGYGSSKSYHIALKLIQGAAWSFASSDIAAAYDSIN